MKRFIETIVVKDMMLARDIIHALENGVQSAATYDIEVKEVDVTDYRLANPYPQTAMEITIRRYESI